MKRGGMILSRVLSSVIEACVPDVSTKRLDDMARELLEKAGAKPSFLRYQIHKSDPPYPSTLCISINDEVVHGPAEPERIIRDGDLVSLDIGAWYEGMATDMAATVAVGNASAEAINLNKHTRESLKRSLATVKEGNWVNDIGAAIEDYLEPFDFGIVREMVGHGVGHAVHEDPQIPHFRERRRMNPVRLLTGMCLAIEPMVTNGDWRIRQKNDGWTIATVDGSLAAHWEVTVAVTKGGFELITPWPDKN